GGQGEGGVRGVREEVRLCPGGYSRPFSSGGVALGGAADVGEDALAQHAFDRRPARADHPGQLVDDAPQSEQRRAAFGLVLLEVDRSDERGRALILRKPEAKGAAYDGDRPLACDARALLRPALSGGRQPKGPSAVEIHRADRATGIDEELEGPAG